MLADGKKGLEEENKQLRAAMAQLERDIATVRKEAVERERFHLQAIAAVREQWERCHVETEQLMVRHYHLIEQLEEAREKAAKVIAVTGKKRSRAEAYDHQ